MPQEPTALHVPAQDIPVPQSISPQARAYLAAAARRIAESAHGPKGARRYAYEPTYLLRGLQALHLEFDRS